MTNQYELVFIMTPVLTEEMVADCASKFSSMVTTNGGKVLHEENWGMRKLAYPITKKGSGFYYLLEFEAPGSIIHNIEIELKRDERVMRFLNVRMDKFHQAFAERRRKKAKSESTAKQATS